MNLFKKKEKDATPRKKTEPKPPKPSRSSAPPEERKMESAEHKAKALRFLVFLLGLVLVTLSLAVSAYDAKLSIERVGSVEHSLSEAKSTLERISE